MKKNAFTLLLLFCVFSLSAKNIVIDNPVCEFKTSGIDNITKIEITNDNTIIHLHATFIPNWWVKFSTQTYIEDSDTGEKYFITDIKNGETDKEIYMPASGDSTFILIFPKLKKTVKKINYGEEEKTSIFGISLDKKQKKTTHSKKIPAYVTEWIQQELSKAKKQTMTDFTKEEFFITDSVKVIGYIKGYDTRAGFNTGIVYTSNALTREDYPTTINIHPDGRFETTMSVYQPTQNSLAINSQYISFYIEPGQTLAIILDWQDYLNADRYRDRRYTFAETRFLGPAAEINSNLHDYALAEEQWPSREVYNKLKEAAPEEFQMYLHALVTTQKNNMEDYFSRNNLNDYSKIILRNELEMNYYMALLDYEMDYEYTRREDKDKPELPLSFYDILKKVPLNDPYFFIPNDFTFFMNRFEYINPFDAQYKIYEELRPKVSLTEYLFEELGLIKTPADNEYTMLGDSLLIVLDDMNTTSEDKDKFRERYSEASKKFKERYEEQIADYNAKYIDTMKKMTEADILNRQWEIQDSIYYNVLQLPTSLVYQVKKTRSLKQPFSDYLSKEDARVVLDNLLKTIIHPYLRNESERLYAQYYPEGEKVAYELPAGKGTQIFRNITDPFKGKYLFVDFWGIFCGPCIQGIQKNKELRESYNDSNDLAFIFITSDRESPQDRYDKFVEEQALKNTYRISSDDYLYLRELFKFNGIPRYIIIDREGRVVDDNSSIWSLKDKFKELLEKENAVPQQN